MNPLQDTTDCVKKHQDTLREAYQLYSTVEDGFQTTHFFVNKVSDKQQLWFLACTLVGIPSNVCSICVVGNYRDGEGLRLKNFRHVSVDTSQSIRDFKNTIYANRGGPKVDIEPYKEELEDEFDLRKTGELGVIVVDLFEEELLEIIRLDNLSSVIESCENQLISNRDLIFEISSTDDLLFDFDTGTWDDVRYMGPNEARKKGYYWLLSSHALNPLKASIGIIEKNKLRMRKEWDD